MAKSKHHDVSAQGYRRLMAVLATTGCLLLSIFFVAFQTELHEVGTFEVLARLCWHNATARPPVLVVLILAGWGFVVRTCKDSGLNIDLVLGGRLMPPLASWHAAMLFLCMVLAAHLVHFAASEVPGVTWRPWLTCNVALHAALAMVTLVPAPVFHHESRFSLLRTLWESVIAPCAPVTFWHVIVADYLTSLAKAFSDLQLSACISSAILSDRAPGGTSYTPTNILWEAHYSSCLDTHSNALMLALPFWWRLMQCLKVYSITREQKNLWNALKYSTAFPLVYAGYLRRHRPSPRHERLFVLAALVQSTYCFIWDVQMDWGLLKRNPRALFGWSMREEMLIRPHKKAMYLLLCIFNLALRFAWALTLFGVASSPGGGMFFLEAIEILRRTVWAVFRIEWEYIVKVLPTHPPYAQVPLKAHATPDSTSEGGSDAEMRADE